MNELGFLFWIKVIAFVVGFFVIANVLVGVGVNRQQRKHRVQIEQFSANEPADMLGGETCSSGVCIASRQSMITEAYSDQRTAEIAAQVREQNRDDQVNELLSRFEWQQQKGEEVTTYKN